MSNSASDATAQFKEADTLFRGGRYREAMEVLSRLNSKFPRQKNILFPMALCLEKLDCLGEAEEILDVLIATFADPRAVEAKERILAALTLRDGSGALEPNLADGVLGTKPVAARPRPQAASWNSRKYFIVGGVVAAAVVMAGVAVVLYYAHPASGPAAPTSSASSSSSTAFAPSIAMIAGLIIQFAVNVTVIYVALLLFRKLRKDTFLANLGDVVLTLLLISVISGAAGVLSLPLGRGLLSVLVGLGALILSVYYFMRHYEMACLEMLLFAVCVAVISVLFFFVVMMPLFFGMAGLAFFQMTSH
jgi:hypothetical protein